MSIENTQGSATVQPLTSENVSLENVLAIAHKHGLRINPQTLELNESGLDFLAAFATDEDNVPWVLRIPRRPDVVEVAAKESRILKLAAAHLPVAVPHWEVHTPELIAYRRLLDEPAATIDVVEKQFVWRLDKDAPPPIFLDSLAEALLALHSIGHDEVAQAGLTVKSPADLRTTMAANMETTRKSFRVPEDKWNRWQAWLQEDSYWPQRTAFIHGDLHPGHMLVNDAGKLTGIIDWTEAEVADLATDFLGFYGIFGEAVFDQLIERYEKAGGYVWPRLKEHVVEMLSTYGVTYAMFALRANDETHMQATQAMLDA